MANTIKITVDGVRVEIEVSATVKAYFDSHFSRSNPSTLQKKKYATVTSLMRAAYLAGKSAR